MQGTRVTLPLHIPGTLAANIDFRWTAPCDLTLTHVSAVASNNSDATMLIGISTDTDSILAECVIGDSQTPVTKTSANWATTNTTGHINKGEIVVVTIDYNGNAGTAAADVSLILTFTEG